MGTKGYGVVTQRPGQVVGQRVDVLVQRVSHGRTLVTNVQRTAANVTDRNHWEGEAGVTLIADAAPTGVELIAQFVAELTLQFEHK